MPTPSASPRSTSCRWRASDDVGRGSHRAHRAIADALTAAFIGDAADIAEQIGVRALDDLIAAHELWSDWLGSGRVRKLALVAERA